MKDKKIQAVVDELKQLPHEVLVRYMTYWMDDVDNGKYVVESDLPHEEWYADCKDYAASTTDEERCMHVKCMAETLGHMLQDIKYYHPNKYPAAMRTVKSWKKYRFIGFPASMKEEIDRLLHPIEIEAKEKVAEHKRKTIEDEKRLRELRLKQLKDAVPFKMGNKWGLKLQDRIVVPPLYHSVKNPVGQYCAVEKNQRHWGIMAVDGKMVVEPKYEDAEVFQDGTAVLTVYKGKTVLRKLKE